MLEIVQGLDTSIFKAATDQRPRNLQKLKHLLAGVLLSFPLLDSLLVMLHHGDHCRGVGYLLCGVVATFEPSDYIWFLNRDLKIMRLNTSMQYYLARRLVSSSTILLVVVLECHSTDVQYWAVGSYSLVVCPFSI